MIIAKSMEEAYEIYKKYYPERQIVYTDEEYWEEGCYIVEEGILDGKSILCNTVPW